VQIAKTFREEKQALLGVALIVVKFDNCRQDWERLREDFGYDGQKPAVRGGRR